MHTLFASDNCERERLYGVAIWRINVDRNIANCLLDYYPLRR